MSEMVGLLGGMVGGMIGLKIPELLNGKKRKKSIIKDLIKDPDSFVMTAYTEGEEIVIKLKKKEEEPA